MCSWKWRSGYDTIELTVMSKFVDRWTGVAFAGQSGTVRK
jgi:hypothetical protein